MEVQVLSSACVVTLGVADLERARRFYEALGLTSGWKEGEDVVFFQAGGGWGA